MKKKNYFEASKPSKKATEAIAKTMVLAEQLYQHMLSLEPTRERSLAITALEEAVMWTNKATVKGQE